MTRLAFAFRCGAPRIPEFLESGSARKGSSAYSCGSTTEELTSVDGQLPFLHGRRVSVIENSPSPTHIHSLLSTSSKLSKFRQSAAQAALVAGRISELFAESPLARNRLAASESALKIAFAFARLCLHTVNSSGDGSRANNVFIANRSRLSSLSDLLNRRSAKERPAST